VRSSMRRLSQLVCGLSISFVMISVFQNCAGYKADFNPLYDREANLGCMGISCVNDLETLEIRVANQQPIPLDKPVNAALNFCNSTTCFDVSGYCSTGGYPQSALYYRWYLNRAPIGPAVRAESGCDSMGRFRVLVEIPRPGDHVYDFDKVYEVAVTLQVIDGGIERGNPMGNNVKFISVAGQDRPR
jgi:hypothetical protein